LRWQLGVPKREDLTMQLWVDAIREDRGMAPAATEQNGF
jgi:redox-sensitive bicupin YhaK (pirin superfamily)